MQESNPTKYIVGGVIAFVTLILVLILAPFTVVSSGSRSVVLHWGQIDRVLDPGIHWVTPIAESVENIDVTTVKSEVDSSASSKDLQEVHTKIAVNYNIQADKVDTLWATFKGNQDEVIVAPSVQEAVKSATAKYTAEELITKREQVRQDILAILKDKLSANYIVVTGVSIVNFDFSAGFNQSVEAKVKAEQDALTAKNKLEQIKFEAEQTIATAKATAESIRLQSDAANNEKYVALKRVEVQLEIAKKWNGVLPVNIYGSAPIPFLDIK